MSDSGEGGEKPLVFKVVTAGNSGVGKTCVVIQATQGIFDENAPPTIGQDRFTLVINDLDQPVELTITDTAGQENFGSLADIYFKGADVALVFYSIDDEDSLNAVDKWVDTIVNNRYSVDDQPILYIIENKIDYREENDANKSLLPSSLGNEKAQALNAKFESVSAKTGENIDNLFLNVGRDCLSKPIKCTQQQQQQLTKNEKDKSGCKC